MIIKEGQILYKKIARFVVCFGHLKNKKPALH